MPKSEKNFGQTEINWNKISKIYERFSIDKTGFVVRDEGYFRWLAKPKSYRAGIKPKNVLVGNDGYVILKWKKKLSALKSSFQPTRLRWKG